METSLTPVIAVSGEKQVFEVRTKSEITSTAISISEEAGQTAVDGDDALNLVGTHARKFDEDYYARLRWKIVKSAATYGATISLTCL